MIAAGNKDEITADVAARLVAVQFPQWAVLPVTPVTLNGWDHTTFRLGDELSLRLPNSDGCIPQVAKEQRWLPVLARQLPLPVPEPVAMGCPSEEFPRPCSVYRWISGEPASTGQVADPAGFASGLAGFLAALQAIDASDGPPAGRHNFFRGGPLAKWDEQTRQLIRLTAGDIDARAATSVWDTALASSWEQAPVWVHGDPACDLVMEWTFFTGDSAAAFRRGLHLDEATWARGRGWALWKALVTISQGNGGGGGATDAARRTIGLVIADHARPGGR